MEESSTPEIRRLVVSSNPDGTPYLTVGAGIPPNEANVIFLPLDKDETPGPLTRYVLDSLDLDRVPETRQFDDPDLGPIATLADGRVIVFLKSSSENFDEETMLARSLDSALKTDAVFAPSHDQGGAVLWIPFLGVSGLFMSILSAASRLQSEVARIRQILVSGPVSTSDDDLSRMASAFRQGIAFKELPDEKTELPNSSETPSTLPPLADDADFRPDRAANGLDEDQLDRAAVARAIHAKVTSIWKPHILRGEKPTYPFMVHISGRWGSGKSSILSFLREILKADTDLTPPRKGRVIDDLKSWVVIDVNAWRAQGHGPAWWSLLNAVATGAQPQLSDNAKRRFAFADSKFRFWRGWGPYLVGSLVALSLILTVLAINTLDGTDARDIAKTVETTTTAEVPLTQPDGTEATRKTVDKTLETLEKPQPSDPGFFKTLLGISPVLAALGAIISFFTTFTRRSQQTAEQLASLDDPTAPLKTRFETMIADIHRPVAVFIDDLDRCDAPYVIELLQAIQTIYVDVPVLYVVAADRDWIVSAYDQVYKGFKPHIDRPAQPLGYLFVKKIFQLSVHVPDLDPDRSRAYLRAQLPGADREEDLTETQIEIIRAEVRAAPSLQARQNIVASQTSGAAQRIAGTEALVADFSPASQQEIEHLLIDKLTAGDHLLDPNPRSIKRLVNSYSFRRGFALSSGNVSVIEKLPYWCVLDLRFPYAAKRLAERPDLASGAWSHKEELAHFPKGDHQDIAAILRHLSPEDIRSLSNFG